MLNFGWVTLASILGVAVCLRKFQTKFEREDIWAISLLCIAFVITTVNSVLYGQFLYQGVFAYTNFCLFDRFNKLYRSAERSE